METLAETTLGAYSARPTKITVAIIAISASNGIAFHPSPRTLGYGEEKTEEPPQEAPQQASTRHETVAGNNCGRL